MTTDYHFGNRVELRDRYALYVKNSSGAPDVVGNRLCNAWGLFDMRGNMWEWCQDWYLEGSYRAFRGGAWDEPARHCRTNLRNRDLPSARLYYVGFRVARTW